MAAVDKYQGEDIPILIAMTDENGNAMNIDDLTELYVYIIHDNTIQKKFSKAGDTGYDALIKITTTSYVARWLSGDTKDANTGMQNLEVNIVESDVDYQDNEKNTIGCENIIYLHKSIIKTESSG